jgi:hypothetical protein
MPSLPIVLAMVVRSNICAYAGGSTQGVSTLAPVGKQAGSSEALCMLECMASMKEVFIRRSLSFLVWCVPTIAFCAVLLSPVFGEESPSASVRRLTGKIRIDGVLDEAAWQVSPSIDHLTQVEPHSGEAPTEATRVWLASNRDFLYIAVRCEDRHPGQIVATEMRRDAMLMENDNIEIVVDTYHDHRNAYFFSTNPVGALVDGRISENRSGSIEWDGIWNVRTHVDESGWTAEFEIPFKTIGFNPGLSQWGFNISRFLVRGRETSRWASPSLDTMIFQIVKAGNITGIENPSQGVGLDIKPYGIAGFSRDIFRKDIVRAEPDAGADISFRITSNLVSNTTINTDFAETEVDARQINLTRFLLFYPEKRSFFLEDAGIFEFAKEEYQGPPGFNMGGDLMPFFSRRIGLIEHNGVSYEAPLRVGEKLTGKMGRFDVGILDVQTGRFDDFENADSPRVASKNLAVGRIKTSFLSQSYVGAIFSNGDPTGQTSNQMGGVDLKLGTSNFLNRRKNMSLTLFGSKTWTSGLEDHDSSYGGILSYPNDLVQYKWINIGENYNPALGFVPRDGVRISSGSVEISPRPEFWNIRRMSFELSYTDYFKLDKGTWESKEMTVNPFRWEFNSGDFAGYEWRWNREQLFEPWMINMRNGIVLPAGTYDFNSHNMMFVTSESRPISFMSDFSLGSFYSGTQRRYSGELIWRKNRHLRTSFSIEKNWISLREGDFDTSLIMCRLDYSFTPFVTLANFVQYDTDSRNIGLQSRLRWILKPGNEFFIVLNHSWQENELDRFESAQTRFRIKFNYTLRL